MITVSECDVTRKSKCKKTAYEIFSNVDELIKANKNREHKRGENHSTMTDLGNKSWYQCKNYSEAEDLALNGWKGIIEEPEFANFYQNQKGYVDKMIRTKNDVVGFAPIVPNVIKGIPQCMINTDRKRVKSKVISIAYNISCTAGISGEEIMQVGFKFMSAIVDLEKQGYRIKLTAIQDFSNYDKGCNLLIVKVKNEYKKLDIYSTMFTLTHTAMFRLIGFVWYEKSPICREMFGYGKKYDAVFDSYEYLREDLREILHDENIVLINASDLVRRDDLTIEQIEDMIIKDGKSYK